MLLPISTAKRKVIGIKSANADAVDAIMTEAKSGNQIQAAQDEAKALLRQRHHLAPSEYDNFSNLSNVAQSGFLRNSTDVDCGMQP
jgi:putative ABC transport system permease protein